MSHLTRALILGGGHGSLDQGETSKLTANLIDRPLLAEVIEKVSQIDVAPGILVVVNPRFADEIKSSLSGSLDADTYERLEFVVQPERTGAAGAVMQALPHIKEPNILNLFADMALWRVATLQKIVRLHEEATRNPLNAFTMATLEVGKGHQAYWYGRITLDIDGRLLRIEEPDKNNPRYSIPERVTVNPSLYAFSRSFLAQALQMIPPQSKGDGREAEYHLPHLVSIAYGGFGRNVVAMPIDDPNEALGVNTLDQLRETRNVILKAAEAS